MGGSGPLSLSQGSDRVHPTGARVRDRDSGSDSGATVLVFDHVLTLEMRIALRQISAHLHREHQRLSRLSDPTARASFHTREYPPMYVSSRSAEQRSFEGTFCVELTADLLPKARRIVNHAMVSGVYNDDQVLLQRDPFAGSEGLGGSPYLDDKQLAALIVPGVPLEALGLVNYYLSSEHSLSPVFSANYRLEPTVATWSLHCSWDSRGRPYPVAADPLTNLQAHTGEVQMIGILIHIVLLSGLGESGGVGPCTLGVHGMQRSHYPLGQRPVCSGC